MTVDLRACRRRTKKQPHHLPTLTPSSIPHTVRQVHAPVFFATLLIAFEHPQFVSTATSASALHIFSIANYNLIDQRFSVSLDPNLNHLAHLSKATICAYLVASHCVIRRQLTNLPADVVTPLRMFLCHAILYSTNALAHDQSACSFPASPFQSSKISTLAFHAENTSLHRNASK